jgi:hypothetical protein
MTRPRNGFPTSARAAADSLARAANRGHGRIVFVSCDPAATSRIRRHGENRFSSLTVGTRREAAAAVRRLRPMRVGFQLAEPLEFSALLHAAHPLKAAA